MSDNTFLPENLVDLSKLQAATGGNSDFMNKMIDMFVQDTPPQLADLKIALDNGDYEIVSGIAHKLKPSVEMMSCNELGVLIRKVESQEGDNPESDADLLVESIERLITQLYKL